MANDARPSERATWHFEQAQRAVEFSHIGATTTEEYLKRMMQSNHALAKGLQDLTVALRATYLLLDQVNKKVK